MQVRTGLAFLLLLALSTSATSAAQPREPAGLDQALEELSQHGKFSGAVVVMGAEGVRFARGYGLADPFEGRAFTPDTPADSGSLPKPATAAAILLLAHEGRIDLDAPVQKYVREYPHLDATVRHLLSHSAGLELMDSPAGVANKSNADLLREAAEPLFPPGSGFNYCNLCLITLALLIERVTGADYLEFLKSSLALPAGVTVRPARLADWKGRAIGYRRSAEGKIERFDSWEGEQFYGSANFSISALQLAEWGRRWSQSRLQPLTPGATAPAHIGDKESGLTLGNWYCAKDGRRCHYLGHHEGFHHMLYWDADRQVSVAMLTNNTLSPGLQQRVQRALIAFVEGRSNQGRNELAAPMREGEIATGRFVLPSGENVEVVARGKRRAVRRGGVEYPAYLISTAIRYVPGLDLYVAGSPDGGLQWLTLYEDWEASRTEPN